MPLLRRIRNVIQFRLEQFILRGAFSRIMVIALAMALLAGGAGLLVYGAGPHAAYADPAAAIWWAFLRLTDSGYLGDDQGPLLRSVSTVLTVLGVVLFVGALIATMTQWLNNTIETLEAGYTPIAQSNHVLILGWNNRTPHMVEQLIASEGRAARFLGRYGGRRLRIVILSERVTQAQVQELKDRLGQRYNPRRITLRSGTPLRIEHLRRVDYLHAGAIVLPAREFDAVAAPDEATIKTLMSAAQPENMLGAARMPLMIAEIFDATHVETARRAYPGPSELIATPRIISRLLAQNVRHRGLSRVYSELLGGTGAQIFVRECPELAGQRMVDVAGSFERAVLLGVARDGILEPLYTGREDIIIEYHRLAFIARELDHCRPTRTPRAGAFDQPFTDTARKNRRRERRVLVLGWNQKLPSLLAEFDAYKREPARIDVFSLLSVDERETVLHRRGVLLEHALVNQIEGDLTSHYELAAQGVADYDNIILVASDWLGSAEAADARMLMGYLVLSRVLEGQKRPPAILVETMATDNAHLFDAPNVERLVSPDLQSNILTQVALRRELHWVMEEIFGPGGAEIAFRDPVKFGLTAGEHDFYDIQRERAACGEILLGVMHAAHSGSPRAHLNPADKDKPLTLRAGDELIVLDVA